jgi:hypothetical protein
MNAEDSSEHHTRRRENLKSHKVFLGHVKNIAIHPIQNHPHGMTMLFYISQHVLLSCVQRLPSEFTYYRFNRLELQKQVTWDILHGKSTVYARIQNEQFFVASA